MLSDSAVGHTIYDILAGEHIWTGTGDDITREAEAKEWLSIILQVMNSLNPADIPTESLSLYQGETRIGGEGAWYLHRCKSAGEIRIVELSTKLPQN
jgi:hypothetical protein